jgi:membrane protease YdiL (CAAX protease family)
MRAMKVALPELRVSVGAAAVMLVSFLVTAAAEEVGWSGYMLDPLQERWGALHAAVLLGLVWAIWHTVPLVQAGRSASWIAWWGLGTVGSRVIIVWLYNNAGRSVFAASVYHAISNLCWQLFPNAGSHYDPRVTSPLIVASAVFVAVIYRPHTLTRRVEPSARAAA